MLLCHSCAQAASRQLPPPSDRVSAGASSVPAAHGDERRIWRHGPSPWSSGLRYTPRRSGCCQHHILAIEAVVLDEGPDGRRRAIEPDRGAEPHSIERTQIEDTRHDIGQGLWRTLQGIRIGEGLHQSPGAEPVGGASSAKSRAPSRVAGWRAASVVLPEREK